MGEAANVERGAALASSSLLGTSRRPAPPSQLAPRCSGRLRHRARRRHRAPAPATSALVQERRGAVDLAARTPLPRRQRRRCFGAADGERRAPPRSSSRPTVQRRRAPVPAPSPSPLGAFFASEKEEEGTTAPPLVARRPPRRRCGGGEPVVEAALGPAVLNRQRRRPGTMAPAPAETASGSSAAGFRAASPLASRQIRRGRGAPAEGERGAGGGWEREGHRRRSRGAGVAGKGREREERERVGPTVREKADHMHCGGWCLRSF
uniref:Uncharacterized protein n=1 Tax=Oryza glaberrima TaxID=4538 RepID=I1PX24_ORYGL